MVRRKDCYKGCEAMTMEATRGTPLQKKTKAAGLAAEEAVNDTLYFMRWKEVRRWASSSFS